MTNTETIYNMPSTCDQLTCEQIDAWLASRKEAGRVIDIETCELSRGHVNLYDPYGVRSDLMEKEMLWEDGINHRIRSPESRGWICDHDLPPDKQEALRDRFKRMHRLFAAACGVHPLWECDLGRHLKCCWKGEGEAPSPDEMIEWFKTNHPTMASEAERRIRAVVESEPKEQRKSAPLYDDDVF